MNKPTKLRREKAPNEGYNYLRFIEQYTLNELATFTLRQMFESREGSDVARRETNS